MMNVEFTLTDDLHEWNWGWDDVTGPARMAMDGISIKAGELIIEEIGKNNDVCFSGDRVSIFLLSHCSSWHLAAPIVNMAQEFVEDFLDDQDDLEKLAAALEAAADIVRKAAVKAGEQHW